MQVKVSTVSEEISLQANVGSATVHAGIRRSQSWLPSKRKGAVSKIEPQLMILTGLSMAVFVTPPIGPSQPQQSAMHSPNFHRQAGHHTTTTFGSYEMTKMMTTRAIFMYLLKALTRSDHTHCYSLKHIF